MSDLISASDANTLESSPKSTTRVSMTLPLVMLFLSSMALGGVAYFHFGRAYDTTTLTKGSSIVDKIVVDLGTIWAQEHYPVTIPVRNRGTTELTIVDFRRSCSCANVDLDSLTVPAGATGVFRTDITLVSDSPKEYQVPTRPIEVEIAAVTSGEQPRAMLWKLRATVRNAIGINPLLVVNEPVVIGADMPRQSVQIIEHIPLQRLVASCDPERAEVQVTRVPGEGGSIQLNIRLKPSETPGTFEFPVLLTPVAEEQETTIPPVKLHVRGRVVEDIYATPSSFAVGILREGQHLETDVVLASRQRHAFEIKKLETSNPSIHAELDESGRSPNSKRIRITSRSFPAGEVKASITISAFDTITERQMLIVVPVAGYILPPEVTTKKGTFSGN